MNLDLAVHVFKAFYDYLLVISHIIIILMKKLTAISNLMAESRGDMASGVAFHRVSHEKVIADDHADLFSVRKTCRIIYSPKLI